MLSTAVARVRTLSAAATLCARGVGGTAANHPRARPRDRLAAVAPPGVPMPPAPAPTSLHKMFGLDGKTILMTGGAGALGAATCAGAAAAGAAHLVVIDADAAKLAALGDRLAHQHPSVRVTLAAADAADRGAMARALENVDRIDALLTFTGALGRVPKPPEDVTDADWDAAIRANATSVLVAAAAARPKMTRGGAIVVVGSIATFLGYGTQLPYAAAKGALGPLTRSLALAWAPAGIRANLVLPGPAATPFSSTVLSTRARVKATEAALPAARLGVPDDFVAPILFFAGDGAAFCTGAALVVDGGGTARGMAPA